MRKNVMYPVTVSFRTTRRFKEELIKRAGECKKSLSEMLQDIIERSIIAEKPEYLAALNELAALLGKDQGWIRTQVNKHRYYLLFDAHHGYNDESALEGIRYEISELKLEFLLKKKIFTKD